MEASVLGFGGSEIGFGGTPVESVETMLNAALDRGINVIDTAECYVDSEEKIGRTIGHRRDDYFLFTKCGHTSGLPGTDWDPKMLTASIDRSLERLQTDHVDVIHLHSCGVDVLRSTSVIEVLQRAKEAGKTNFIGYSGDSDEALFALNLNVFDSLQTSCNFADQQSIALTLPVAKANGVGVIAKRPVANIAWKYSAAADAGYAQTYWERLQELKFNLGDPLEDALQFTLAQDVHTMIVGMSRPERIDENAEIVSLGAMPAERVRQFRDRWAAVAKADWVGQN